MKRFLSETPYFIDLHEDIAYYYFTGEPRPGFSARDFATDIEKRNVDIPKYKKANVKLVFAALAPLIATIYPERESHLANNYGIESHATTFAFRSSNLIATEQMKIYFNLIKKHSKSLQLVEKRHSVSQLFSGSTTGLLISMEGAEPLEDVGDLEVFYKLGVRSLLLTWNLDNKYSASCMSKKDYGITGEGESLIDKANELGIIIDLAHASKQAAKEAIIRSKLPAIVSHANVRAVKDHPRNVDDEILTLLRENRGLIGFTLIAPTISDKPNIQSLADHIMYVYENWGSDILAIGTDYLGLDDMPEPEGLEDISRINRLWSELLARGMKESDIDKISYKNALRVIDQNAAKWRSEE